MMVAIELFGITACASAASHDSPSPQSSPTATATASETAAAIAASPTPAPMLGPIVTCASGDFATTLTTDSPTYGSGQTVTITATITNTSEENCDHITGWLVNVRLPDGSLHEVSFVGGGAEAPGAHFPPGDTRTSTATWDDDSSSRGTYTVIWDWFSGTPHVVAQVQFAIV